MSWGDSAHADRRTSPRRIFGNPENWGEPGASYFSRFARIIALTLAIVVGALSGAVLPTAIANAVVVEWGTNGGQDPNYQATVNGDFINAGNGVLQCQSIVGSNGTCNNLHAATYTGSGTSVNDNAIMGNVNAASGFTTNSSSATVTIPSGAKVVKAFLNWSANTGTWQNDSRILCTTYSDARGVATLPSGSATGYQTRAVQFKVGTGAIAAFAPDELREDAATQATTRYYSATADVTSAFANAATGSALTLSAGNIWTPTGAGCYAGWSITLVYDFGTYIIGNANSVPHRVIYYEGHVREGQNDAALTVDFNGFTAVDKGTRAGFTLYEGDRGITGDVASYSRAGSTSFTEIPNSATLDSSGGNAGVTGNIGIGRASGSVRYFNTSDTSAFTNQSVDVASASLANVVAGDSKVTLQLGTSGDSYLLTNAVLSVPTAGIQVSKSYNGTDDIQYRTGTEKATFTIRVTNTGAGILQNIKIVDDQADCSRTLTGTLAPLAFQEFTCTATNNTSAGYTSTATATATTVVGGYLAQGADSTTVAKSSIALTKTSAFAAGATGKAGDTVNYTLTATNNGAGPLTGVTITDPLLPTITYGTWASGTTGTLNQGGSVTATGSYVLKQTDVDAGSVANTASTTGTDADGGVKPTATAPNTQTVTATPAITLSKTGALASGATGKVGDTINYTFVLTNTGNVTLKSVGVSDPLSGLSSITYGTWTSGTANQLNPGGSVTATATYTIKQADVDRGNVPNTATATGTPPTGSAVAAQSSQTVTVATAAPAITTTKSAAYTTGSGGVNSVVTYTFTARNSGNVTLTGVAITDPHTNLSAISYGTWPSGTSGTLAPGQTITATATYTVTQADVDAGTITNTSTARGTSPTGTAVSATANAVIAPVTAAPNLTFAKTGSSSGQVTGSTVTYTFTLTNSGNVTLTGVGASDPLSGLSAITYGTWPSGTAGRLAPGQTVTGTATYTLKQTDVDAGAVSNTSTATATPPTGAAISRTSSATVPITATGTIAVTKSGAYLSGTGAVGSVIRWTITFRNSGNVTLSNVTLTDSLSGLGTPTITWPGTTGTLAPGATATAVADYTVKQSDVDAGSVKNTASVTARTPAGATATGASPEATVTTATAAPAVTVAKTGAIAGGAAGNAGDVITYTFTVRNTGNVTLTNVAVADPLSGLGTLTYTWPTSTAGTLAPGATATATASYTIKQSDVDTGNVKNTATVTGRTPAGGTATNTSGQVTTNTAAASPSIATTKAGQLASGSTGVQGDTINWTITLRNSGNVTLTGVAATDSLTSIGTLTYTWPTGQTAGTLAPGQTATATGTSTLSQSDVDSGAVSNIATGSGTSPTSVKVSSTGSATVAVTANPDLSITKTPSVTSGAAAGSTITYTFVVRNIGNVTLNNVTVTDPLSGLSSVSYGTWTSGTANRLLPGGSVTATATYVVKQSDVDTGSIKNTASASGTAPGGATARASSTQVTVTTVASAPAVSVTKTAAYTTGSGAVGSVITYTFTARNTGNVTLTNVAIADPHTNLSAITYGTWPSGTSGTLAPSTQVTATATYTVVQSDVDAGSVKNTATVSGRSPNATVVNGSSGQVSINTVTAAPATTFTKTGVASGTSVGSTVTYTFKLKNTGNVTLTGATITDPLTDLSAITVASWPSGTVGKLNPNDEVTGTATYTLKQSDVDAGSVANTSTATANPPTGAAITRTSSASVPIAATGVLAVTKSGALATGATGKVGDTINWSIRVTNTGNVTMTNVAITDSLSGLSALTLTWPAGQTAGTLAPNQFVTATATSTITQAQVDAGTVSNVATATGRTPAGATITGTSPSASVSTLAAAPAISLVKTSALAGNGTGVAGDVVNYTFTITNTGNVTLKNVSVADPMSGLSSPLYSWPSTAGQLAPGAVATATATYTIKQSDVDNGSISNTATATGTPPTGAAVTSSSTRVTNTATAAPSVATTKTGQLATGSTGKAGDTINWSFTLRNTGNVTLTGVVINDPLTDISARTYTWPTGQTAGTLAPGQTVTATATYVLKQSDVNGGSVVNTASGVGTSPKSGSVSGPAQATVTITASASLSLTKTPSITSGAKVGDTITYTFVARNTGNVTLTNVAITDTHTGLSTLSYTWPTGQTAGTLAPAEQVTATATYLVTQDDVNNGVVNNSASVSGTTPKGGTVSSTASVSVPATPASPSLTLGKEATVGGTGGAGSVITYRFTLTNTGNVTVTGARIVDPLPQLSALDYQWPNGPPQGTLNPGDVLRATATYTITQADVDRGNVQNRATGYATPKTTGGTEFSTQSPQVTTPTAASAPKLTLTKTGTANGTTTGSTISYAFTLKNDGNVTLTSVGVSDPLLGANGVTLSGWTSGTVGTLKPGDTVNGTGTYTLKQSDVDAGSVVNTATATGTPPTGAATTTTATRTTPIAGAGALTLAKTASPTSGLQLGNTVTYSFTITNTGNVTLSGVTATDPMSGLSRIDFGTQSRTVAPGGSITGTATYTVSQADVNRGSIANTATATGQTPAGATVSTTGSATVTTVAAAPSISAAKSAVVSGSKTVGDRVTYTIVATNTGNVTLTGVTISDPMFTAAQINYGAWPTSTSGLLQPGQTITATAVRTITQPDVDAGGITNTATATGTPPTGANVSGASTITTPLISRAPAITLAQTGALAAGSTGKAGDTVNWSFTITNSGNTTLTGVQLSGLSVATGIAYGTWPGGVAGQLAPGQSVTATGTSTLTQTQVDARSVTDDATVTGTAPSGVTPATVSAQKPATVTIAPASTISIVKTGSAPANAVVGDKITYGFTITNTGATSLSGVAISDPRLGSTPITYTGLGTGASLAPGATATASASYTITQADIDAGTVTNTATVAARDTQNTAVSGTSNTVTVATGVEAGAISIAKSASPASGVARGGTITYTFTVTNTGNVTLTGVGISDPKFPAAGDITYGAWPGGTANTLAPGASVTATATHVVSQADFDLGRVDNQATATGTTPANATVTGQSAVVSTSTASATPKIGLTKSLQGTPPTGGYKLNDTVTWAFTITNSGDVSLSGVAIADQLAVQNLTYSWPTGTAGALAPNATATATATYTVTQADVDAGSVVNNATASGTPSRGAAVTSPTATATASTAAQPGIALTKSAAFPGGKNVGDTITYTFVARNTGNQTITGVVIDDPLARLGTISYGAWPTSTAGTLPPNTSVTGTASYTIAQSDIDSGAVTNTANVTGRSGGTTLSQPSNTLVTPVATAGPALTATKAANVTSGVKAGDVIRYRVALANTGNQTLHGVTATDPLNGLSAFTYTWPGAAGVLAPGQSATARANYTVTQADVDAGSIANTAHGDALTPGNAPLRSNDSPLTISTETQRATIAITDSGALPAGSAGKADDIVTWTYVVTNTGNVTLRSVGVTETQTGATAPVAGTWPGASGVLAPGESVQFTSTYKLTQADVDAGKVTSNVSTVGTPLQGTTKPTANATADVTVASNPGFTVIKRAEFRNGGTGNVGDTIRYYLDVANTGNVTLSKARLSDHLPGLGEQFPSWPDPSKPGVIPPGATATGYADYVVTQDDVDRGSITNTAGVGLTPPTGAEIVKPSNTVVTPLAQAAPVLTITETGVADQPATAGKNVTWTVTVTNNGNVTVKNVVITDPALQNPVYDWGTGTAGQLAPGKSVTLTGTTVITQGDVDAGQVTNSSSAQGVSARDNTTVVGPVNASATVPTTVAGPSIDIVKTATKGANWADKAGDTVVFTYTVTNNGNQTLTGVTATDPLVPGGITLTGWTGATGRLAPGQSVTATVNHTVTLDEVNAGTSSSAADTSGTSTRGATVADSDTAGVPIASKPGMTLAKTGTVSGTGNAGSTIDYRFRISNTGNVTLSLIALVDSLPGIKNLKFLDWPDESYILDPGQFVDATANYTITQSDVDTGNVTNKATASGKPPVGDTIYVDSPLVTTTVAPSAPKISVTQTVSPATGVKAGDQVTFTVTATNTGNVSLSNVTLADSLPGLGTPVPTWPGQQGTLAVGGQPVTWTIPYTVTQADVDAGSFTNIATVTGTSPTGANVSGSAPATVTPTVSGPQIGITDSGALAAGSTGKAGDTVIWSYVITNTGDVTLRNVTAAESQTNATAPVFGAWPDASQPNVLAPGQSVTATSSYTLTQADVDRGTVTSGSSTTANGPAPTSTQVTASAPAQVTITQTPDYTVQKASAFLNGGVGNVGDTIRYTLTVKNTGNVSLYNACLKDPLQGLGPQNPTWPTPSDPRTVRPGETATGYADYVVTQADVDAGSKTNTATASFWTDPSRGATCADPGSIDRSSNTVVTPLAQARPVLGITETGVAEQPATVGKTVTWTVTVTNNGNVTVTNVALSDPQLQNPVYDWGTSAEGVLAPGKSVTLTGTTTITQNDVDAGAVSNVSSATGISARDNTTVVGPVNAGATVPTVGSGPGIDVTKSAQLAPGATGKADDLVNFSYTLTNNGNVTLTDVSLADALGLTGAIVYDWKGSPAGTVPVGTTITANGTYRLTQADVDRGSVSSAVTGTGTAPNGVTVTDSDTAGVTITAAPKLAVTKAGTVRGGGAGAANGVIDYAFTIKNDGNVTLTLVDLVDSLGGVSNPVISWPSSAPAGTLVPGATATATANYTITQGDIDRGTVANVATSTAKPPVGDKISQSSNTSNVTVGGATTAPTIRVTETPTPATGLQVGDIVRFDITIENSGTITVNGTTLSTTLSGLSTPVISWPGAVGTLAPGQIARATADYRVTQADVDRGSVSDTASSTATGVRGGTASDSATAKATTVTAAPKIAVTDEGRLEPGSTGKAGDDVQWLYRATNTGNTTLTGVTFTESLDGSSVPTVTEWPDASRPGVLLPGEFAYAVGDYTLTQSDVDAGSVRSRISTAGVSASSDATRVTADADATVTITARPALSVVKSGALTGGGLGAAGDTIRYALDITNTGNVTVYQGNLVDPLPGLGTQQIEWPDPAKPGVVPPGETVHGEADYKLTQADVDRGYIDNTASVEAWTTPDTKPADKRVTATSNTVRITTEQAAPQLTVIKSATVSGTGKVGDTITYTIETKNTGNVTVKGLTVGDPLPRLSALVTTGLANDGSLAPGATATSTGTYVLEQADIDTGSVTNQATASGTSARDGAAVSTPSNQLVTPTLVGTPKISVTDAGALDSADQAKAGGKATWTYVVTNDGDVTLSNVHVDESLTLSGPLSYAWTGTPGVLAPKQSVTVTAPYALSQGDVDAGSVISTVRATGTPKVGADATADATATIPVVTNPVITVDQTAKLAKPGANAVGDQIDYTIVITNTGPTTLSGVTLSDTLAGLSTPTIVWPDPAQPGVIPPGQQATATASYQIAQKDVDLGHVDNRSTSTGQSPTGQTASAQSEVTSIPTGAPRPAMTLTKGGALRSGTGDAGSVVRFTFTLKNTGNVTISALGVAEKLQGAGVPTMTFPTGTPQLAPGATATGYSDYTLTQADVDLGYVDNTATATGASAPDSAPISTDSNTYRFTTSPSRPRISTTQDGVFANGGTGQLNDVVDYTFTVTNTGNTTLTGVTLANTVAGLTGAVYTWPAGQTAGTLAPGQVLSVTAQHTVTQADVDAGVIRNVATGSGTDPKATTVTSSTPELVLPLATASPDLELTKVGTPRDGAQVGDTIDYVFELSNTGTQTVHGATISDGLPGVSTIAYGAWPTAETGVLPPNTSVTATATYVVTQADVDRGDVTNTATASALDPSNGRLTTSSQPSVVTTPPADPGITIAKTAALAPGATGRAGDLVNYTFVVTNSGNVTLENVTVADGQADLRNWTYTWPGTPGVLKPGEKATVTAQHQLTQPDIDAGVLDSTATTDGTGMNGADVNAQATDPVVIAAAPALTLSKTAAARDARPTVGTVIDYTFVARNTGNVTLDGVVVNDPLIPADQISYGWPGANGRLAPGESVTARGSYTVTQADVDAGAVANTATADGLTPDDTDAPEASSSAVVQVPNGAAITLAQSVRIADGRPGFAGDVLVYTYVITNTGTVDLHGVTLTDPKKGLGPIVFGDWPGAVVGDLAPGQSVTATAEYVIQPSDEGALVRGTSTVTAEGASAAQQVDAASNADIQLPARPGVPGIPGLPGAGGGLAHTGVDPSLPGLLALMLLLWGGAFVGLAARRRRKENA
ncbi:DUF11 domain-containing protein [Schumannella sp. 10F1B-5-1]|uniref:beta strand repeat-containing protein n=1 Tax=Schumannella sp. 10F1B-5-1 TaxID=2590780 RepID=UPI00113093C7|nr:DUF11 domain-containing protein [Schumannella sp. 10F1B-5-1]TPW76895.1 DUF11 domain-containing protein [Schumannella sp. 10F1B-5-1]